MIRFACRCGHNFEAPADAAGTEVQCPECGLLNDVPRLSELDQLDEEGIFRVRPSTTKATSRLDLLEAFTKESIDENGIPIDLRNAPEEMTEIGDYDNIEADRKRHRPRYDPETGELIRPIPVVEPNNPKPAPIPFAKPVVVYSTAPTPARVLGHVLLELVQPVNIFVLAFVFAIHLIGAVFSAVVVMQLYFSAPILLAALLAIVAHYGNVVDEIGVDERDELPRVLRDFRFYEDIWWPIVGVVGSLTLCYGPAIALFVWRPLTDAFAIAAGTLLIAIGSFFLPAVALTLLSSGSLSNLRPDRVIAVMNISARRYAVALATYLIALIFYAWTMIGVWIASDGSLGGSIQLPDWVSSIPVLMAVMLIGMFVMHAFCWQLGLLYRANHELYPWVGRYHDREASPPVLRRKRSYVTPPPTPHGPSNC